MATRSSQAKAAGAGEPSAEFLDRVTLLAARIAAAADAIERARRLPDALIDAMIEAGLFHMLVPKPFGGAELDPVSFAAVIEAIAKLDASTAWCLCQNTVCSTVAAFLPPDTAREVFDPAARNILAWGPGPEARALRVAGGYRVSGRWSFASGGRHATWLGGQCTVFESEGTPCRMAEGRPLQRTMLFPAASATMIDTWDVIGLRGTASDTYTVEDVFVPATHAVARDDPSERRHHGPLYCFRTNNLFGCGFASVALGLARSLLDAFVDLAHETTPRAYKSTLRQSAVVQSDVAEAEARLRAARLYLTGTLSAIWQEVVRSNELTLEQRMAIRLAATHTIEEAVKVADMAYHAAGATAIFASNPFERRFRDIHAVAQQLQGRRSHFETVGKYLLGLEADTAFL